MTKGKFQEFKKLILIQELSSEQAAWSTAVAFGTVFLPLPGIQLIAVLPICLIFRLNIPIVYIVNWINNPFTLAPITFFTYFLGYQILKLISLGYVSGRERGTKELLSKINISNWSFSDVKNINFAEIPWAEHWAFLQTLLLPYLLGSVFLMVFIPLILYRPVLYFVKKMKGEAL